MEINETQRKSKHIDENQSKSMKIEDNQRTSQKKLHKHQYRKHKNEVGGRGEACKYI